MNMVDSNLRAEKFVEGLESPTTMAFLGPDDILVLEKDKGTVMRIVNGVILEEPIIDVNVGNKHERGMLGIAIAIDDNSIRERQRNSDKSKNNSYVFLYFTKGETKDGEDSSLADSNKLFGNSMYRYELVNESNRLVNPKLMFELPPTHRSFHNGGALLVGPDNNIYVGTGDLSQPYRSNVQNVKNGSSPAGTGGILRFTQDGGTVGGVNSGILGDTFPLDRYYAYGIRNTFGMDFDPISGILWDTENGPYYGDEINIVEPGFNSGWSIVQGLWRPTKNLTAGELVLDPDNLVTFNQKGKYSSPELIWKQPVGPTAIKFLNSDKLGKEYEGGILRITQDGKTVQAENDVRIQQPKGMKIEEEEGILGDTHPLNKYYAYGIRNSFGMDFDPVTGRLWDTENGAGFGDEINLVDPGFNSGRAKIQGIWSVSNYTATPPLKGFFYEEGNGNTTKAAHHTLIDFSGKGRYSAPEFTWNIAIAPTALKFYDSDKLGKRYENDMFVAGFLRGEIYNFELNKERTTLSIDGALKDRIANNTKELEDVIFATGFGNGIEGGGITDIEVGPYDGYLYLLSYSQGNAKRLLFI